MINKTHCGYQPMELRDASGEFWYWKCVICGVRIPDYDRPVKDQPVMREKTPEPVDVFLADLRGHSPAPDVTLWMQEHQVFLRHRKTCAADTFVGLGCNCGLRAMAERIMAALHASAPASPVPAPVERPRAYVGNTSAGGYCGEHGGFDGMTCPQCAALRAAPPAEPAPQTPEEP